MAGLDIGGVASWLLAAGLGLGILWAINEGMLRTQYSLRSTSVPIENVGLIIFLAAIGLEAFYFLKDVGRKI
jgi:uncharacterized transporter YbjL